MFRRLLVGLVIGILVGGVLAAGLVAGLKLTVFAGGAGLVFAYLAAAVAGVATGLFAGKPIWEAGAKVEAGLKAFFGALLAVGGMFALRQWAGAWVIDLSSFGDLGKGAIGALPAASLPLIAGALGALFELDNTGEKPADSKAAGGKGSEPQASRKRVSVPATSGANGKARALAAAEDAPASPEERRAKR
jgi:hypothetical protein